MDKETIELLQKLVEKVDKVFSSIDSKFNEFQKEADLRHMEVLERFNTIEDKMDGIAYQFEKETTGRLTDKEYTIHKIYKLEKDIFNIKKTK